MQEWDQAKHSLKSEEAGTKLRKNDGRGDYLLTPDNALKEKGLHPLSGGLVKL